MKNLDLDKQRQVKGLEITFKEMISLNGELTPTDNRHFSGPLIKTLNKLFPEYNCTDVLYTINNDKPFFGVRINPSISALDALSIITTEEPVKFNTYQVELDSKMFDMVRLSAEEITTYILYEVSSYLKPENISMVRAIIDLNMLSTDDVISIRDSANYSQLIIYSIKDTLFKLSSLLFKDSDINVLGAEYFNSLIGVQKKIFSSPYGLSESERVPNTAVLQWMLSIYKDVNHNSRLIKETLKDAKECTGSKLEKNEIDKTIKAIDRIENGIMSESTLDKSLINKGFSALLELSLFKSLKQNGLRSIEDSLYEFSLRIKNCDTEEDAMYILRGINTRLSILEDYIYNTPELNENERKHWELIAYKFRELREVLAKRKIVNKKQYGLFFDYDQLDTLDKSQY